MVSIYIQYKFHYTRYMKTQTILPSSFKKENIIISSIVTNQYRSYYGNSEEELLISFTINNHDLSDNSLNYFSKYYKGFFIIYTNSNQFKLRIPIFNGQLKLFYNNFEDYYYLPKEDTCIYKSVAEGVEKKHRINANKSNCYTKHSGRFLPLPASFDSTLRKSNIFKEKYASTDSYILLDESYISEDYMKEYIYNLLLYIN